MFKNYIYITVVLVAIFSFIGCEESLTDVTKQSEPLELSRDTLLFNVGGGIKSAQIFTNQDSWRAEYDNAKWYIPTEYRDADGYEMLTIETDSSTLLQNRESVVNITAGAYNKTLYVIQLGNAPSIMLETEQVKVDMDTTVVNIPYVANIDFNITNTSSWITTERIENTDETILRLKIAKNKSGANREYGLELKQVNGEFSKIITVMQSATLSAYEPIDTDKVTGNKKIPVISGTASSTYADFDITKSFDGDYSSYFQSDFQETETLEFAYKLDSGTDMLSYIVYYPATEAPEQAMKFGNIYIKKVGETTFTKVLSFQSFDQIQPKVIEFSNPIENVDEVKFEVAFSYAPTGTVPAVSCAEVEFYTSAVIYDNIFTDITYSELLPDVTIDDILNIDNAFYQNLAKHLLNGTYQYERILDLQPIQADRTAAKIDKASLFEYATGIEFATGEEAVVFCGEQTGAAPSLLVLNTSTVTEYQLKEGVNKLSIFQGGKVYVNNPTAIKVHIATGNYQGTYDSTNISSIQNLESDDSKIVDIMGDTYHIMAPLNYAQSSISTIESVKANLETFIENAKTFYAVNTGTYQVNSKLGIMVGDQSGNTASVVHLTTTELEAIVAYTSGYDQTIFNILEKIGAAYEPYINRAWRIEGVTSKLFALNYFFTNNNYSVINENNLYAQAFQDIIVTDLNYANAESNWSKVVPLWQLHYYATTVLGITDYYAQVVNNVKTMASVPTDYTVLLKNFTNQVTDYNFNTFYNAWNMGSTATAATNIAPEGLAYITEKNKGQFITPADIVQGIFNPSLGGYPSFINFKNSVGIEVYNAGFLAHIESVNIMGTFYQLKWADYKSHMKIIVVGPKGDKIQVN